jgi:Na+/melibiose symporter-like transporter
MYQPVNQFPDNIHAPHMSCWTRNKEKIAKTTSIILVVFYMIMSIYGMVTHKTWPAIGGIVGIIATGITYCLWLRSHRRHIAHEEIVRELSLVISDMEINHSTPPQDP